MKKKISKKAKILILISVVICLIAGTITFFIINKKTNESVKENNNLELPKPEITGGARGELGIDKNINEKTIDKYLNRKDAVYRDMRMLEDPGDYESIGGDRFLSGFIEGFEVVPLPYIIPVTGLPDEVGDTYTGDTLFRIQKGRYVANYEESMEYIEKLFPKDKIIFLMCGGGGYAGMMKQFLVEMGWNPEKIYNIGGYWYYNGDHNVIVKSTKNGKDDYDFSKVTYHEIFFDELTKTENYKEPTRRVESLYLYTQKFEIEEGNSFKIPVGIYPTDAVNRKVEWISSNPSIATVNNEGLVEAKKEGKATITVKLVDGNKKESCIVEVSKKGIVAQLKLDDITNEINEFSENDPNNLFNEFYDKTGERCENEKYFIKNPNGDCKETELYQKEYKEVTEKWKLRIKNRTNIINNLFKNKKTFLLVIPSDECEERPYEVAYEATKLLERKNIQHIYMDVYDIDQEVLNVPDEVLEGKSIVIVKNGKYFAGLDPDVYSIKNEKELINWLSKYLDYEW